LRGTHRHSGFTYGVPPVASPARTIVGYLLGALSFTALGFLLGTVLPNARAAQGIGLLLFFPMFLLGGAGPPPEAMSEVMQALSDYNPLAHAIRALQEPWLELGTGNSHIAVLVAVTIAALSTWLVTARRYSRL
jgi:ABC-2 type transport system permease protein